MVRRHGTNNINCLAGVYLDFKSLWKVENPALTSDLLTTGQHSRRTSVKRRSGWTLVSNLATDRRSCSTDFCSTGTGQWFSQWSYVIGSFTSLECERWGFLPYTCFVFGVSENMWWGPPLGSLLRILITQSLNTRLLVAHHYLFRLNWKFIQTVTYLRARRSPSKLGGVVRDTAI